jgi:hypothetical protein
VPLDKTIVGVDGTRLPQTGKVPIYTVGDVVVFSQEETVAMPSPLVLGDTNTLGFTNVQYIEVRDQNGNVAPHDNFTFDNVAGTVVQDTAFDETSFSLPFFALVMNEDMRVVNKVDVTGQIEVSLPISNNYDKTKVNISSALLFGDIQANLSLIFDQNTWTGEFSDTVIGAGATASYNDVAFPIQLTNAGAIKERFVILFTGSTTFDLIGEKIGNIASGDTATDFSPINIATGEILFTLLSAGWGAGWGSNKALRLNFDATSLPFAVARCTQQGDDSVNPTDNFQIQIRGDF